jgi:hypothetical protein
MYFNSLILHLECIENTEVEPVSFRQVFVLIPVPTGWGQRSSILGEGWIFLFATPPEIISSYPVDAAWSYGRIRRCEPFTFKGMPFTSVTVSRLRMHNILSLSLLSLPYLVTKDFMRKINFAYAYPFRRCWTPHQNSSTFQGN